MSSHGRLIGQSGTALLAGGLLLLASGAGSPGFRFSVKAILGSIGLFLLLRALSGRIEPRRRRRMGATAGLLVLSVVLSLGAAELAVRRALRDVTTTSDNRSWFARRWWKTHPPVKNRLGYRGREVRARAESRAYRIALVGDSFAYGQGLLEPDRLSELLERQLSETGRPYEVLNFGVPGAETVDELRILDTDVLTAQPDFVLLEWYVNDVEGHEKSDRPHYRRLLPSDFATRLLQEHSALFYVATEEWQDLQVQLGLADTYEDYMERRFADPAGQDFVAARDDLVTFFRHAREAGSEVGAVLFPRLEARSSSHRLDFLIDRVLDTCDSARVICVDMRPELEGVTPARKLWANRLDSHPGRLANEIAAHALRRRFAHVWELGG
ncbi:MAG: SGNH/GDSL hydrolase family protein [Gemmatimonadota bacterium]